MPNRSRSHVTDKPSPPSLDAIIDERIDARLAQLAGGSRWMRAVDSPLGLKAVKRLVREGKLPSARPSKHLLIDRDVHDALIAAATPAEAPAEAPAANDDLAAAFGVEPTSRKGGPRAA